MTVRWCRARISEVPTEDGWLTDDERTVLAGLSVAKRRDDWRLGRWTAKRLVGAVLGVPARRIEVRAADDGAPEALVDGAPAGLSLSLSHRDGVAVAAVTRGPAAVGIDLETVEPRSDAFVREWLSQEEQSALPATGGARDAQVLCCWCAKEASAKVLREGLRLDVRQAVVVADSAATRWAPLTVTWRSEQQTHRGWWRHDGAELIAVVSDPPSGAPADVTVAA